MKKQVKHAFGKTVYLLGADKNGTNYWLEEGSWDCDWYWGIGYVETYTNNKNPEMARDIDSHSHFNGMFLKGPKDCHTTFKEFFQETTLDNKELWTLLECMNTLYTLREYSDMLHTGGSHISTNPLSDEIKSISEYDRINKILIPNLLEKVYELLSEKEKGVR